MSDKCGAQVRSLLPCAKGLRTPTGRRTVTWSGNAGSLSEAPRQTTLGMCPGAEAGALSIDSLERGRWRLRRTRQALVPTLLASSLRPLTLAPALLHSPRTLVGRDYSGTRRTRVLMSSPRAAVHQNSSHSTPLFPQSLSPERTWVVAAPQRGQPACGPAGNQCRQDCRQQAGLPTAPARAAESSPAAALAQDTDRAGQMGV